MKFFLIALMIALHANMEHIPANFHELSITSLNGKDTIDFASLKGKKVLCVNVASECGYTPQYQELQQLQEKYRDELVVIGFPCNQFGKQEPGTPKEIEEFCKKNYGVDFLLTEKIDVKGENQHPVYQWLTKEEYNGQADYSVKWNFNKFLVDEKGKLIAYFGSGTKPMSEDITELIEQ